MVKAIIFDLDDTLISEREYIKSGFNVVANIIANDYKLEKENIYQLMNELFEENFKNVFNRTLDKLEISYDMDYIKYLIKIYRDHKPNIKFFDDVIPIINELKKRGYKIGMITDGYKETQRAKIKALNCDDLFDEIIITDELGREFWKTHEKSYRLMSKKLKCDFKDMTYVGDNEEKDFVTANRLAIKTVKIVRANCIYINTLNLKYKAKYEIFNLKYLV